jgi:hypothetical protein
MEEQLLASETTPGHQPSLVGFKLRYLRDINLAYRVIIRLVFRFSAFQIVGAWANTGFSLVDQNLIPFQPHTPYCYSWCGWRLLEIRDMCVHVSPISEDCRSKCCIACFVCKVLINRSMTEPSMLTSLRLTMSVFIGSLC